MKVSSTMAAETRGCTTDFRGRWSAIHRSFCLEKTLEAFDHRVVLGTEDHGAPIQFSME
jgi:hypothetical protein